METTVPLFDRMKQLVAAGQHAEVVAALAGREEAEVADSPRLALLYGSAQARLGRPADGQRWVEGALREARKCGDREVEKRALSVRGGSRSWRGGWTRRRTISPRRCWRPAGMATCSPSGGAATIWGS